MAAGRLRGQGERASADVLIELKAPQGLLEGPEVEGKVDSSRYLAQGCFVGQVVSGFPVLEEVWSTMWKKFLHCCH